VNVFWSLALRAQNTLRERTFYIASVAYVGSTLSNVRTSASRVRTFFIIVDLFYVMGGLMSLARDRFNSSGPRVTFSGHSRFACGPFSPRVDLFLLHTWTLFY
jgi:hypothetical protein